MGGKVSLPQMSRKLFASNILSYEIGGDSTDADAKANVRFGCKPDLSTTLVKYG